MLSIRAQVYYLIRRYDIELAEAFAHRCPEVPNVLELNTFFHHIFSQHQADTRQARQILDDTLPLEIWLRHFEQDALPVLRRLRFPPPTAKDAPALYVPSRPGHVAVA